MGMPAAMLTTSDAEAQTVGMERRQDRRDNRRDRCTDRRDNRRDRRDDRRGTVGQGNNWFPSSHTVNNEAMTVARRLPVRESSKAFNADHFT
jgi:hypothetical protein